jgi:hypothetical protein
VAHQVVTKIINLCDKKRAGKCIVHRIQFY